MQRPLRRLPCGDPLGAARGRTMFNLRPVSINTVERVGGPLPPLPGGRPERQPPPTKPYLFQIPGPIGDQRASVNNRHTYIYQISVSFVSVVNKLCWVKGNLEIPRWYLLVRDLVSGAL